MLDNRFYTCIIKRYDFPVDNLKPQKVYLEERLCVPQNDDAPQIDLKFKSDQDYLDEVNIIALAKIQDSQKASMKQNEVLPSGKISSSSKASWNTSSSSSNTSSLTIFKNRKFYKQVPNTSSLNNRHDNDSDRKKRLSKSIVFKFNNNIPVDYDFIKYNRIKYSNFYSNCNLVKQDVDKLNCVNNFNVSQNFLQDENNFRQQKLQNKNLHHSL